MPLVVSRGFGFSSSSFSFTTSGVMLIVVRILLISYAGGVGIVRRSSSVKTLAKKPFSTSALSAG